MDGVMALLGETDTVPVEILRPDGAAPFLLVCDHAGRRVPESLRGLGLAEADLARHIGWDIGAGAVTRHLSEQLDAMAILQTYSRLVIDCNRRPGHPTSIVCVSDGTEVPANRALCAASRAARVGAIFAPYHAAIAAELDRRKALARPAILIAIHSFTPVMDGSARPWQTGVLHNRDPRLARAVALLLTENGFLVGDNEPYALGDDSDYTVPVHAEMRGLPYLELEIRQDLIADDKGQQDWARRLSRILPQAARVLSGS